MGGSQGASLDPIRLFLNVMQIYNKKMKQLLLFFAQNKSWVENKIMPPILGYGVWRII